MSIYEKINEAEILCTDIIMPKYLPIIYVDEHDNVYCYNGTIDKDRFLFNSYPYYLKEKKTSEIKDYIRGYFRISGGRIFYDKRYIDEKSAFNTSLKYKVIPASLHMPQPADTSFGVYSSNYKDLEDELTRKIFGLTYTELQKLIVCYNKTYNICSTSIYNNYPSITRSIKNDNFCDISRYWIPSKFPYISFAESEYYYSHISLGGFYQTIKFITMCDITSTSSKIMISNGLDPQILKNLFNIDEYIYDSIPIDEYLYNYLYDA